MAQQFRTDPRSVKGKAGREYRSASPLERFGSALKAASRPGEAWTASVAKAAEALGGDMVVALPRLSSAEAGPGAVLRFADASGGRLVLFHAVPDGEVEVREEADIDEGLARFARASIRLLDRIGADGDITRPLGERPH